MHDDRGISRRSFIQQLSLIGGAGAMLAACGGGEQQADSAATGMGNAAGGTETADAGFSCTDTSGLTETEIQARQNLQYVDETPDPAKTCEACNFYQMPMGGAQCGGCTILKGPIHPNGFCNSWVVKQQTG